MGNAHYPLPVATQLLFYFPGRKRLAYPVHLPAQGAKREIFESTPDAKGTLGPVRSL